MARMKGLAGLAVVPLLSFLLAGPVPRAQSSEAPQDEAAIVERGRYLATVVGGCASCHTPHQDGQTLAKLLFSGHPQESPPPVWNSSLLKKGIGMVSSPHHTAFAGPWGTSFASNLTPDHDTGLGSWNENMFIREMRRGEFNPPMPTHLRDLTRSDLRAIWRYLRTVPAVPNRVPDFQHPRPKPSN